MLPGLRERTCIALVDDGAAVQDNDAVGVVGEQRLRPGHAWPFARRCGHRHEAHGVKVVTQRTRQRAHRPWATRDADRRDELAPMREAPTQLRELHVRAVVEGDPALGWRRVALHPPHHERIAGAGVEDGRRCRGERGRRGDGGDDAGDQGGAQAGLRATARHGDMTRSKAAPWPGVSSMYTATDRMLSACSSGPSSASSRSK